MRLSRRRLSSGNQPVELNLTSLMDIFTILLLFLLVHFGEGGIALPEVDDLKLPMSSARALPAPTINLMVNAKGISVDGRQVMTIDEAIRGDEPILKPVKEALVLLAENSQAIKKPNIPASFAGKVTILGDRKIPFHLLKKIMTACAQAGYTDVSLAVMWKEEVT